jgi:cytochrome c
MIFSYLGKHRQTILTGVLLCNAAFFNVAMANEQLMEKAGCIACHHVDDKLIGPAFKSIAAKYRSVSEELTLNYLTNQVRDGSEGVWGDIPMAPNPPSKVSDEDLKTVLEWILGL